MNLKPDINIYLHRLSVQVLFLLLAPAVQTLPFKIKNLIQEFFNMFIFRSSVKIIIAAEKNSRSGGEKWLRE